MPYFIDRFCGFLIRWGARFYDAQEDALEEFFSPDLPADTVLELSRMFSTLGFELPMHPPLILRFVDAPKEDRKRFLEDYLRWEESRVLELEDTYGGLVETERKAQKRTILTTVMSEFMKVFTSVDALERAEATSDVIQTVIKTKHSLMHRESSSDEEEYVPPVCVPIQPMRGTKGRIPVLSG